MPIPLEQITPGMLLSEDVFDAERKLLLRRGTELTAGRLDLLKRRGIAEVSVIAVEPDAELIEQSEMYLRPFFACVDGEQEAMAELYRLSVLRTARLMASGWIPPAEEPHPVPRQNDLFFRGEGSVTDLVEHEVKLVTFPDIYFKVRDVIDSLTSTAGDIAEVVSKDTSLSLKILRLVNSPLYGFSSSVQSVRRAVTLLGFIELSTLTLGIIVVRTFEDIPSRLLNMKSFWRHSVAVGVLAELLAGEMGMNNRERFFVAGMLHDAGRLVMVKNLPRSYTEALLYSRANGVPLVEAEQDVFGFNHGQVGGKLLNAWSIPLVLESLVRFHHTPMIAPDPREAAVIHWADIMAIGLKYAQGGSVLVPPLIPGAWEALGISPDCLQGIVEKADREIETILSIFFS
ncbi:MAG: HDOD domain-containing protein [Desulfovibrionales bacterium]